MPKRFRKKPVEIEAWEITNDNYKDVAEWCGATTYERFLFGEHDTYVLEIPTLEGVHEAVVGYFVIKGVAGEFYGCEPSIFEQTYEEVK